MQENMQYYVEQHDNRRGLALLCKGNLGLYCLLLHRGTSYVRCLF